MALIWLSVRNGALALFAQAQPFLTLPFWPAAGGPMAASASQFALPQAEQRRIATEALNRDPLSNWPLILAGQSASAAGDNDKAITLLKEAVRRNSRFAPPRSELLQLYIAEGRWAEVVDEGLALSSLRSSAHDSMMEVFLLLLTDVRGRAILATRLEDRPADGAPSWRDTLIKMSAGRPGEAEMAALMANLAAGNASGSAQPTDLSPDGYLAWVKQLPAGSLSDLRAVYDGEFKGLPGPPPYGWDLLDSSGGRAAVQTGTGAKDGLLSAEVNGAEPKMLARQVLVLSPGRYILKVEASAGQGSEMAWRLNCLSGRALGQVTIPQGARSGALEERVVVPAGCPFQSLALVGAAADPRRRGQSGTDSISIRPAL